MRTRRTAVGITLSILGVFVLFQGAPSQKQASPGDRANKPEKVSATSISGPIVHENLSVFVIHGRETIPGKKFLTLGEALEQQKVVVRETGNVNQLEVVNKSEFEVFIQAGDIVRGGKQDRMIGIDIIIEAHSGPIKIEAYCVEQGRWHKRGDESASGFSSSRSYAPSNSVKIAAKLRKNQRGVWSGVSSSQEKLKDNLKEDVASRESGSSLQLTLENAKVRAESAEYIKALAPAVVERADAIGIVIAINNRLYSSDTYCSHELLKKMAPKLLEAAAVQAIALKGGTSDAASPSIDQVVSFCNENESAEGKISDIAGRVKVITKEDEESVEFLTLDSKDKDAQVHLNRMRKVAAGE